MAEPPKKTLRDKALEQVRAKDAAEIELAKLYARVAGTPSGRQVLSDIASSLAAPDFECAGLQARGEGFLARYREASRITAMIDRGREGR